MFDVTLYTNSKGEAITHSSYSARSSFRKCAREFELTRIKGYSEKQKRAAPLFGRCIESGVQFYEENNRKPGSGTERFTQLWKEVALLPDFSGLVFKDSTENNWEQLMRSGREMLLLYEFRAPFLPISTNPPAAFQQIWRKKIFPNSEFDILENKAIIDILSFPRWNHPLLPQIPEALNNVLPNGTRLPEHRPLIIDVKTSGVDLDTELVALDPQLGEYAWQGRIPDIGFLWFVKKSPDIEKGSRVTLLEDIGDKHAGFEMQVLWKREKEDYAFVGTYDVFSEYKKVSHNVRGKNLDAFKEQFSNQPNVFKVPTSSLTKQRLQFVVARLTEEDMDEIGRDVAQTTVEQIRAHKEQYYPKSSGIRFPHNPCQSCSMRWICLKNSEKRDELLTRKGEEWLDGDMD